MKEWRINQMEVDNDDEVQEDQEDQEEHATLEASYVHVAGAGAVAANHLNGGSRPWRKQTGAVATRLNDGHAVWKLEAAIGTKILRRLGGKNQ